MKIVKVGQISFANNLPMVYIGGPCVIEGEEEYLYAAKKLHAIFKKAGKFFVLKASFDKANRTSIDAYRGPGLQKGMAILQKAKAILKVPVLTDIHEPWHAEIAAQAADILQIPAFLSRQTDLVAAAAKTGKAVNIKKGQFSSPASIINVIKKIEHFGNNKILLTERGASFGYGDLVVDMRSLQIMADTGYPVIFDVTHSLQKPGGAAKSTGGDKRFANVLARSASAAGIAGIFFEAHQCPPKALSDSANSLSFQETQILINQTSLIDDTVKKCLKIK